MQYQVYYESVSYENIPVKWYAGYPIQYKYGQRVTYPEPIETYRSQRKAQLRAEELACILDLNDYKYTNVKVYVVEKGKRVATIPYRNRKHMSKELMKCYNKKRCVFNY